MAEISCQKSWHVGLNENSPDGLYLSVLPIRGVEFGAADCDFSRQISSLPAG